VSSMIDRALGRWIEANEGHPIAMHIAVGAVLVVCIDGAFFTLVQPTPGTAVLLTAEAAILLLGVSLPIAISVLAFRRAFLILLRITQSASGRGVAPRLKFVEEELRRLDRNLSDLRHAGVLLEMSDVAAWVRDRCFSVAAGRYVGTDPTPPSVFADQLGEYLSAHAAYLERRGIDDSSRICMTSLADLRSDVLDNPADFAEFVKWHRDNRVELFHMEPERALEIARDCGMPGVIDLAYWDDEYCLLWGESRAGVTVRVAFAGEETFAKAVEFIERVGREAGPFPTPAELDADSAVGGGVA
jgi:hypothetical protein